MEKELWSISLRKGGVGTREGKKVEEPRTKEVAPDLANIITVVVITAVSSAVQEIKKELTKCSATVQRNYLLKRYDNDKLQQYMCRDNLRFSGIKEDEGESETVSENKIINIASDIGVELQVSDISDAHRLSKPGGSVRPVLVKFCQRKKREEVMKKKRELKKKKREIYINSDLTPVRASLLKLVTHDCKLLIRYKFKDRPITLKASDDLYKLGINVWDWKCLGLDHPIVFDD